MKEINWFIVDKNKVPIESHKLIYEGNKIIERSYINIESNKYTKII